MARRTNSTILGSDPLDAFIAKLQMAEKGSVEEYRIGNDYNGLSLPFFMRPAYRKHGFNVILILGKQGVGKSYYGLQSIRFFLKMIGFIPRDSNDMVGELEFVMDNYLTFISTRKERVYAMKYFREQGNEEVLKVLEKYPSLEERMMSVDWRNPYPVLMFDEAGLTGNTYDFYMDRRHVQAISNLIQVARRRVSNLIITTTNPKNLLVTVRDNPDRIIVVMREFTDYYSYARGYIFPLTAMGSYVKRLFDDVFYKWVPDEFHYKYMSVSDKFVDYALARREILDWMKKREKKREKEGDSIAEPFEEP